MEGFTVAKSLTSERFAERLNHAVYRSSIFRRNFLLVQLSGGNYYLDDISETDCWCEWTVLGVSQADWCLMKTGNEANHAM